MAVEQSSPPKESNMKLVEILSDLVSLRVCDPNAALALVSARSSASWSHQNEVAKQDDGDDDVDLKRAKDLLHLHYGVREAQKRGEVRRDLEEARASVERAVGAGGGGGD